MNAKALNLLEKAYAAGWEKHGEETLLNPQGSTLILDLDALDDAIIQEAVTVATGNPVTAHTIDEMNDYLRRYGVEAFIRHYRNW